MINKENVRDNRADILKGILILCVVFGHSLSMVNALRNVTWNSSVVNVFFTSFEMPFFSLISGYFIAHSLEHKKPLDVIKKRLFRFIPVLLIWCTIPEIIKIIFELVNDNPFTISDVVKRVFNATSGRKLWFIFAYLFCSSWLCSIELIDKHLKRKIAKLLNQVFACAIFLIFIHVSPLSFGYSTFLLPFFYVGYALGKIKPVYSGKGKIAVRFGCLVFPIVLFFYQADYSFYLYGQNILTHMHDGNSINAMTIYMMRFILALVGCCFIYECTHYISLESRLGNFLCDIGKNSLSIYILSMYLQELIKIIFGLFIKENVLSDFNVLFSIGPIFFVLLIYVCIQTKKIINRFPRISRLLLGD
jgi:fucose 4-O-acetylase-like acetyltransferase